MICQSAGCSQAAGFSAFTASQLHGNIHVWFPKLPDRSTTQQGLPWKHIPKQQPLGCQQGIPLKATLLELGGCSAPPWVQGQASTSSRCGSYGGTGGCQG